MFAFLLLAGSACGAPWQVGGLAGVGWLTAPGSYSKADALRPMLVLVGDGWLDKGPVSLGLGGAFEISHREGTNYFERKEKELVALTSGFVGIGKTFALSSVPARYRLLLGAGVVHSWNELDRDGRLYQQESWGPEFRLGGVWEREIGRNGMIRAGLSGVNSWTAKARIHGTDLETEGNWSRVEFCLGWSWSNRR